MNDYRLPLDEQILLWLNGLGWTWLDAVFVASSSPVFGIGMAIVFALWVLFTHKRKAIRGVVQATFACVLADNLGHLVLKPWFGRMRPNFALPPNVLRHWAEAAATGPSLPSLHAATSFSFAVGLGLCLPRTLWITLPIAALISISRVAVGVHWPSDVLAGAIYGALVGLLMHVLFQRWWPRVPPETRPDALAS